MLFPPVKFHYEGRRRQRILQAIHALQPSKVLSRCSFMAVLLLAKLYTLCGNSTSCHVCCRLQQVELLRLLREQTTESSIETGLQKDHTEAATETGAAAAGVSGLAPPPVQVVGLPSAKDITDETDGAAEPEELLENVLLEGPSKDSLGLFKVRNATPSRSYQTHTSVVLICQDRFVACC